MRLFVIGSDVPYRDDTQAGVSAVNIVLHELLLGLRGLGHAVGLQLLFNPHRTAGALTPSESAALDHLTTEGITVLPPIEPSSDAALAHPRRWLRTRLEEFYPSVNLRELVRSRVLQQRADAVVTVWSPEGVAAVHGLKEVPTIAYHGDVDFMPQAVRLRDRRLFAATDGAREWLRLIPRRRKLAQFKRAHLALMRTVDVVANVTASNAEFYRRHGHPRSVYIPNTWSDVGISANGSSRDAASPEGSRRPIHIIGHVGHLGRTGSTYGLHYLLTDVMPALETRLAGLDYRLHVIGGGDAAPSLRPLLRHERIVLHGFVDDLDRALRLGDMFLLLNNAGAYQAAFTRHIIAWSMGLCLIVHAKSRQAIPEIAHMDNALVGETPAEIAELVFRAATDPELNQRIRRGGRATYERRFRPAVVAQALSDEIARAVG